MLRLGPLIALSLSTSLAFAATPGSANVGTLQQVQPDVPSGASSQLGNVVSAWYYGSQQGMPEWMRKRNRNYLTTELAAHQCPESMCFGKYLAAQLDRGVTPLPQASLDSIVHVLNTTNLTGVNTEPFRILGSNTIYSSRIVAASTPFGNDLRAAMRSYALAHDPSLLQEAPSSSSHCTVHFRVGDLLEPGRAPYVVPTPSSVARAVASFDPPPSVVEIMGGGADHRHRGTAHQQTLDASRLLLSELRAEIRLLLPSADVRLASTERSADADLYKMSLSPMLVTASGSFGTAGALAAVGARVLSPRVANLLFHQPHLPAAPARIRNGWWTYATEQLETNARAASQWLATEPLLLRARTYNETGCMCSVATVSNPTSFHPPRASDRRAFELLVRTDDMSTTLTSPGFVEWDFENYLQRFWHPGAPRGASCASVQRFGNEGDGGKSVCDAQTTLDRHSNDCVIVSVGSNGDVSFEEGMRALHPSCDVHIYDPFVTPEQAARIPNWATFYAEPFNASTGRMRYANRSVAILKIDCTSTNNTPHGPTRHPWSVPCLCMCTVSHEPPSERLMLGRYQPLD